MIENKTIKNKCSKCGECCSLFIPLTKKEVAKIKEYVKENNILPEKREHNNDLEVRCPFLNLKTRECKIYPIRPYVCKDFICSRKNWRLKRLQYAKMADYNGLKKEGRSG